MIQPAAPGCDQSCVVSLVESRNIGDRQANGEMLRATQDLHGVKMKPKGIRFARKSDGLGATVCKDIPPRYQRTEKITRVPGGKVRHSVSLPREWEEALQETYPDISIPMAIILRMS